MFVGEQKVILLKIRDHIVVIIHSISVYAFSIEINITNICYGQNDTKVWHGGGDGTPVWIVQFVVAAPSSYKLHTFCSQHCNIMSASFVSNISLYLYVPICICYNMSLYIQYSTSSVIYIYFIYSRSLRVRHTNT